MNKSCACGNFVVNINGEEGFSVARRCGCKYCILKAPEYVSDPSISISFEVFDESKHVVVMHGHETGEFHECKNCGLVLVTSNIDGQIYCVLNAKALSIKGYNLDPQVRNFIGESIQERLTRRKYNWSPVRASSLQK